MSAAPLTLNQGAEFGDLVKTPLFNEGITLSASGRAYRNPRCITGKPSSGDYAMCPDCEDEIVDDGFDEDNQIYWYVCENGCEWEES